MIHTVKGFSIVNEAEVDVFLEFSHFFHYPTVFNNMKGGVKISIFFLLLRHQSEKQHS